MLKFIQLAITVCCLVSGINAQTNIPQVPSKMTLGDMKLTINDGGKRDIQKDVNMLRASDRFFKIKLERIALYLPIIERILKEEGIPDDIKYLAIQESALISDAVSSAKAVGFWQFKDFTGREVGMRVDNKVDERKNIVSSTHGAAKYFRSHQRQLDNWAHTVTAHMTGAGGIKKYVSSKDYGSKKMTITSKSHWYLKRFLAHKIAFQNATNYQRADNLMLKEYTKGAGKDLKRIAKDFDVDIQELQRYNKWLSGGKIPGDKKYTVIIPVKRGSKSSRTIAKTDPKVDRKIDVPVNATETSNAQYPEYIKPGIGKEQGAFIKINGVRALLTSKSDDFNSVLDKTGLSKKKFLKYNDLNKAPTISAGQTYFTRTKKPGSKVGFHVALPGESLWVVSQRYGIKLNKLAAKNRMSIIDNVKPGRVLWLNATRPTKIPIEYHERPTPMVAPESKIIAREKPKKDNIKPSSTSEKKEVPRATPPPPKTRLAANNSKVHQVNPGETLWAISRKYNISVADIRNWNDLGPNDDIQPGQELFYAEGKSKSKPIEKPTKVYVVKAGDTLYQIARANNMSVEDLLKINQKESNQLSIGEELKIAN